MRVCGLVRNNLNVEYYIILTSLAKYIHVVCDCLSHTHTHTHTHIYHSLCFSLLSYHHLFLFLSYHTHLSLIHICVCVCARVCLCQKSNYLEGLIKLMPILYVCNAVQKIANGHDIKIHLLLWKLLSLKLLSERLALIKLFLHVVIKQLKFQTLVVSYWINRWLCIISSKINGATSIL